MTVAGMFSEIKYTKLDESAKAPTRAHESDAGNDLYALEDFQMFPGQTKLIKTGIAVEIPEHAYGQVASRSSLARKGVFVTGGVIDAQYRGEVGVLLNNLSDEKLEFRKGDKIAQLVILPIIETTWVESTALSGSNRGSNGFGSSGR